MSDAACPSSTELRLLGPFSLRRSGKTVQVPTNGARLLALLALRSHPVNRRTAAGLLWPEKPDERAGGNLRTVIWRLPAGLVETMDTDLALAEGVHCDVTEFTRRAHRLINGASPPAAVDLHHELYDADLLPAWSEDWVAIERERIRQLRIHALDMLSMWLTKAGRYSDAIAAGLASVAAEPLRESGHRTVITAHLAEGNQSEALKQYESFRNLLAAELGLDPSPRLSELIRSITRR
jgi:DNA-binding SARP family transcriptional activator